MALAVLCAIVFAGDKVRDGIWVLVAVVFALGVSLLMIHLNIPQLTFPFVLATWITLFLKGKMDRAKGKKRSAFTLTLESNEWL